MTLNLKKETLHDFIPIPNLCYCNQPVLFNDTRNPLSDRGTM
jgi:hypothetical protein